MTRNLPLGGISVSSLLLSACLVLSMSARSAGRRADVVFENGNVITLAHETAQAFAVRGDRFLAVGSNRTIERFHRPGTKRVDLKGATVIPGLTDSHDHLWNTEKYLVRGVDLVGVDTVTELTRRLRDAVSKSAAGGVVFTTTGWNLSPAPTRRELDEISPGVPVVLIARRRGAGLLNTAALRRLGITKESPFFLGERVPVDADGDPTGAPPPYPLSVYMIDALLPRMSEKEQDLMVHQAMAERNALGITSIRELAIWPDGVLALQRMRQKESLTVRIALGVEFPDMKNTAGYLAEMPLDRGDPWLFLDCSSEEPWPPGSISEQAFAELAKTENKLGWRPAPHVSADASRRISYDDATDQTLSAYQAASKQSPLRGKRWYIEHVPFATATQIARMRDLGLIVSTQDFGYPPATVDLPASRLERINPIREFISQKLVVVGGSDYAGPTPRERMPNNPMIPFYFYTTRKDLRGDLRAESQKVSRLEALRLFTVNAAFATFQEKAKGRIVAGMLADFVILNQDLMTVPDAEILNTHPLATFVGGRQVYTSPDYQF